MRAPEPPAEASLHSGSRKGLGVAVCIQRALAPGSWHSDAKRSWKAVQLWPPRASFRPRLRLWLAGSPGCKDTARAKMGVDGAEGPVQTQVQGPEGGPRIKAGCWGGGFQVSSEGAQTKDWQRTVPVGDLADPHRVGILARGCEWGRLRSPGPHLPLSPPPPTPAVRLPQSKHQLETLLQDGRPSPSIRQTTPLTGALTGSRRIWSPPQCQ